MRDAQAGDHAAARAAPADRRQKQLSSPCWGHQHPASSPVLPPPAAAAAPLVSTPPAVTEWERHEQPVGVWRGAGSRSILHGSMKAGSAPPGRGYIMGDGHLQPQKSALPPWPSSRCAAVPIPVCHVPSQPPPHHLALWAPIASSALENRAGIARICPHHRASRGSDQHPGHGQGTESSREGLDLSSGSRVPSRASLEAPGGATLLPSVTRCMLPAAPCLSRPLCSGRWRNTAPCRNQLG